MIILNQSAKLYWLKKREIAKEVLGTMMGLTISQLCKGFELSVDKVRQLSKGFCQPLGVTTFGYVRVYKDGCISWITSNPDQDRFLIESGAIKEDPLVDTPEALKEGKYLWFNDRQFPGCEAFYRERSQRFHMDHGLVIVRHQKEYLETCCFSGLVSKRPLYNLFMQEQALFSTFMEHFTTHLDRRLLKLLEQGVTIDEIKAIYGTPIERMNPQIDRASVVKACGWENLLILSRREKECLALLKKGYTYQMIGASLKLSERTVEHYLESIKNKLSLETRSELVFAAEKLSQLGIEGI